MQFKLINLKLLMEGESGYVACWSGEVMSKQIYPLQNMVYWSAICLL
jgi:hypothetical protein